MFKKLFITVFLLAFLVPCQAGAQNGENSAFPDVDADSPYFAAIEYLYEKDIIQGYPDGTFRPNQEANRAEALKIILLGSGIEVDYYETYVEIFPDVKRDDWHYPYIRKAKETGIVEGYQDGYFRPHITQNLAETLKIILLTNNIDVDNIQYEEKIYPDVTDELWYKSYAAYAKQKNIISPQYDGNLNAGRGISRGELAEIMYRTAIVIENDGEPFDISSNWPEFKYPTLAFKTKKPFGWEFENNQSNVVFWRRDKLNNQSSYQVTYPYSASVIFHLDENTKNLSHSEYVKNLEKVYELNFGTYQKNSMQINGYNTVEFVADDMRTDYYMFMDGGKVLNIYTVRGQSDLSDYMMQEIEGIIRSTAYTAPHDETDAEKFLSEVRERILVEGLGRETLDMFNDLVNIETDTIGVGTGPVDYYYSEMYDVTLKYERDSDTILDMRSGKTSAF